MQDSKAPDPRRLEVLKQLPEEVVRRLTREETLDHQVFSVMSGGLEGGRRGRGSNRTSTRAVGSSGRCLALGGPRARRACASGSGGRPGRAGSQCRAPSK